MKADSTLRPRQNLDGNLNLFGATGLALLAWGTLPEVATPTALELAIPIGLGVGAGFGASFGAYSIWQNFRKRNIWQQARTPYQEKDDRLLSEQERQENGMREPNARLMGTTLDGQPFFLPHKKIAFQCILGAQGTAKTTSQVIASSILTPLLSGKSVFINDVKKENLPQVIESLKKLGLEVLCVNIGSGAQDICPGVEVAPYGMGIDAYHSDDREFHQLTNTFIRDYAKIAVEIRPDEKTPFFGENGQKAFHAFFTCLLVYEPDNVTPTRMLQISSDLELAVRCLERIKAFKPEPGDTVIEDGQRAASTLLDLHKGTPKYLPQFLNKIVLGLSCYDATGPLANFGQNAVGRISDMRKRQMVFASMIPLANLNDMRTHVSFLAYNFFGSAKAFPNGHPIHGIIDEFQAINIPNFAKEMLSMRGLKVSSEVYIQSFSALEETVGPHQARVILEQSDVIQALGFSSYEDAERYSKILGKRTVRQANANISGAEFENVGFNFQDRDEPLFTPTELLALPDDEQIVQFRGLRPDHLKKVPYWDVDGLKQLIAENPLEGPPPETKPKFGLKIDKEGVELLWWNKLEDSERPKDEIPKKERLVRLTSFLWLFAWLTIFAIGGFQLAKPEPHFYFAQSTHGCEYFGLRGDRVIKRSGFCHPIWVKQERD